MEYFFINNIDLSSIVNSLVVSEQVNYTSQTNANGDTIADYINSKKVVKVGIIPITTETTTYLKSLVGQFDTTIKYLDPDTNELHEIECILPQKEFTYYTIKNNVSLLKQFELTFYEL
jgi:hypothetical protein